MAKKKDISVVSKVESGIKSGGNSGRNPDGTFSAGNPGSTGRPKGSYTKSPLPFIEQETFKSIAKTLSDKAIAGDTTVCLHLCPKPPSPPPEPIYCTQEFDVGPTETADQIMTALSRLRIAYSKGEISEQYHKHMEGSIMSTYKVYEAAELIPTLKSLQEYIKKHEKN